MTQHRPASAAPRHAAEDAPHSADVVVLGHGLAGLAATCELLEAGRRVVLVDQERPGDLGGQAWWSFGGLFLVDSPEQRRLRVRDSVDLAWRDWQAKGRVGRGAALGAVVVWPARRPTPKR